MGAVKDRGTGLRWAIIALRVLLFALFPAGCIFVYVRVSYMVTEDWFSELLVFAMVPMLLLNLLLAAMALPLRGRAVNLILPLIALLVAQKPMKETFALNFRHEAGMPDIRVMSFNVASFNPSRMATRQGDTLVTAAIYSWLREMDTPDVLCIQEFYHSDREGLDQTLDSMVQAGGYTYYYMNPDFVSEYGGIFGTVSFFKQRPIRSGRIPYSSGPVNKGMFHDIVVEGQRLRILNFHLSSMSIRWQEHPHLSLLESLRLNIGNIFPRLREGNEKRKDELECIFEFIDGSPYPVIACADLNALPYSETYQRLLLRMNNTFEAVGLGMGITYHHFPFYVRIDNQFFSEGLRPEYFLTHREFKFSDHYPIEAGYSVIVE